MNSVGQTTNVLEHAKSDQLRAYVVLSPMTGVRTEEACTLRWSHVVALISTGATAMPDA
jgi:hypothetical protein